MLLRYRLYVNIYFASFIQIERLVYKNVTYRVWSWRFQWMSEFVFQCLKLANL